MRKALFSALLAIASGAIQAQETRPIKGDLIEIACSFVVRDVPSDARSVKVWAPVPRQDCHRRLVECCLADGRDWSLITDPDTEDQFLFFELTDQAKIRSRLLEKVIFRMEAEHAIPDMAPGIQSVLLHKPGPGIRFSIPEAMPREEAPDYQELKRIFLGQAEGSPKPYVQAGDHRNLNWHAGFIMDISDMGIPARLATGLVLSDNPFMDDSLIYYWAEFYVKGQGWRPVAELLGNASDRCFVLSSKRDVVVPGSTSGAVEFFNRPLIELDGQSHLDVETFWTIRKIETPIAFASIREAEPGRNL